MTYKTHLSTGILFSSIYFLEIAKLSLSPTLIILLILATIIGASTPDLDTPSGGLWQKMPAGGIISRIVNPIFIGGHRHLSHSIIGMVIFSFLFYLFTRILPYPFLTQYLMTAFIIGFLSHIFADLFTEEGVPILFPFGYHFGIPPAPFESIRIKTGHWFENLIIYPMVNIAIIITIYHYIS